MIDYLKKAMSKAGMTQVQFAKAFGISQPMLSQILTGKKLMPAELARLVRAYLQTGQLPSSATLANRRTDNPGK